MERPERGQILPPRLRPGNVPALALRGTAEQGVLGSGSASPGTDRPPRAAIYLLRLPPQASLGALGLSRHVRARLPLRRPRRATARPRALRLLHSLFLGHLLLPPAYRSPEDEFLPLLAARSREPGLDQRELPGADAEGAPRALHAGVPRLGTRKPRARRARPRFHGGAGGRELPDPHSVLRLEARLPGGADAR